MKTQRRKEWVARALGLPASILNTIVSKLFETEKHAMRSKGDVKQTRRAEVVKKVVLCWAVLHFPKVLQPMDALCRHAACGEGSDDTAQSFLDDWTWNFNGLGEA